MRYFCNGWIQFNILYRIIASMLISEIYFFTVHIGSDSKEFTCKLSGECMLLGSLSSQQRFGVMDIKALGSQVLDR